MAFASLIASLGACLAVTVLLPFCAGHRYCTVIAAGVSLAAVLGPLLVRSRGGGAGVHRRFRRLALLLVFAWSCANVSFAVLADAAAALRTRHRETRTATPHAAPGADAPPDGEWTVDVRHIPVVAGTVLAAHGSDAVAPVAGAVVRLYTEDRTIVLASAVSGPDGRFLLDITVPQPGNSYVMVISHPRFRTYASLLQVHPGFRYEHQVFLNPREPDTP